MKWKIFCLRYCLILWCSIFSCCIANDQVSVPAASLPIPINSNVEYGNEASYSMINHDFFQQASSKQLSDTIVVLSIDGGGTYGIIPLKNLINIEHMTDKKSYQLFNVMAGVSTGTLIVSGLSLTAGHNDKPIPAQEILNNYYQEIPEVFSSPWWYRIKSVNGMIAPRFTNAPKRTVLEKHFGEQARLSQLSATQVLLYATSISHNHLAVFDSKQAAALPSQDYQLVNVLMATTATPLFWPPFELSNIQGADKELIIDSALYFNNPSYGAVMDANRLFPGHPIVLLSLGTGLDQSKTNFQLIGAHKFKQGLFRAIEPMMMLSFEAQSRLAQQSLVYLFDKKQSPLVAVFRLNITRLLDSPGSMNSNTQAYAAIDQLADQMIVDNRLITHQLITILNQIDQAKQATGANK
ncbi:MAG: hypothetical protein CL816_01680 [Coxiellaceae bacterium]|nr:hypothetical protein [Coxiellaceae bacterium]